MRNIAFSVAVALLSQSAFATDDTVRNPLTDQGSWQELSGDIVGDKPLKDGASLFDVDAPYRAHDAATVPIVIKKLDMSAGPIKLATLVIDENPAPVAVEMVFGKAMDPLKMEVRVRVNQYSNVRVIAETDTGSFMHGKFVKASGGCSAPASRDPEIALISMGIIRLKHFGEDAVMSNQRREAQIMIRHPNYSGLQRDQITQLFIGAHFIDELEVFQGNELLFKMIGGISVSENPVFRFDYTDNGSTSLRVRARDTEGNVWEETLEKQAQS